MKLNFKYNNNQMNQARLEEEILIKKRRLKNFNIIPLNQLVKISLQIILLGAQ